MRMLREIVERRHVRFSCGHTHDVVVQRPNPVIDETPPWPVVSDMNAEFVAASKGSCDRCLHE